MPQNSASRPVWLACPVTASHTDLYWRWLPQVRSMGIEMLLCPAASLSSVQALSSAAQDLAGLVLWGDDEQSLVWAHQARTLGLQVRWLRTQEDLNSDWASDLQANRGCRP